MLELVARVPYQAWEHVAYNAVTHTHEAPSRARRIHDLWSRSGPSKTTSSGTFSSSKTSSTTRATTIASAVTGSRPRSWPLVYYQLSWLLYVVRPALSHRLNADFEDHAEHTYMHYVNDHPELDTQPWQSEFASDYGTHGTVGDLFRQIGLDERAHKQRSLDHLEHPRFSPTASIATTRAERKS